MINRVTLVGHIGKDPETKTFDNGGSVARITVATNESYKDKDGNWQTLTDWHIVVVFNKDCSRLKKGALVFVKGKLKTRTYKDANGVDKSITEVNASLIRALERTSGQTTEAAKPETNTSHGSSDADFPFDDLPF